MSNKTPQVGTLLKQLYANAVTEVIDTYVDIGHLKRMNREDHERIVALARKNRELWTELENNSERRIRAIDGTKVETPAPAQTEEVSETLAEPPPKKTLTDQMSGWGYTCLVKGHAFKGEPDDIIAVPVAMNPVLHRSNDDKWSWRTKVHGHDDYRHINVSNLHSIWRLNDSNIHYVLIDAKWKTTQPVFKDWCNK